MSDRIYHARALLESILSHKHALPVWGWIVEAEACLEGLIDEPKPQPCPYCGSEHCPEYAVE